MDTLSLPPSCYLLGGDDDDLQDLLKHLQSEGGGGDEHGDMNAAATLFSDDTASPFGVRDIPAFDVDGLFRGVEHAQQADSTTSQVLSLPGSAGLNNNHHDPQQPQQEGVSTAAAAAAMRTHVSDTPSGQWTAVTTELGWAAVPSPTTSQQPQLQVEASCFVQQQLQQQQQQEVVATKSLLAGHAAAADTVTSSFAGAQWWSCDTWQLQAPPPPAATAAASPFAGAFPLYQQQQQQQHQIVVDSGLQGAAVPMHYAAAAPAAYMQMGGGGITPAAAAASATAAGKTGGQKCMRLAKQMQQQLQQQQQPGVLWAAGDAEQSKRQCVRDIVAAINAPPPSLPPPPQQQQQQQQQHMVGMVLPSPVPPATPLVQGVFDANVLLQPAADSNVGLYELLVEQEQQQQQQQPVAAQAAAGVVLQAEGPAYTGVKRTRPNSSRYKAFIWCESTGGAGKVAHLGTYATREEAAARFNEAARFKNRVLPLGQRHTLNTVAAGGGSASGGSVLQCLTRGAKEVLVEWARARCQDMFLAVEAEEPSCGGSSGSSGGKFTLKWEYA